MWNQQSIGSQLLRKFGFSDFRGGFDLHLASLGWNMMEHQWRSSKQRMIFWWTASWTLRLGFTPIGRMNCPFFVAWKNMVIGSSPFLVAQWAIVVTWSRLSGACHFTTWKLHLFSNNQQDRRVKSYSKNAKLLSIFWGITRLNSRTFNYSKISKPIITAALQINQTWHFFIWWHCWSTWRFFHV